MATPLARRVIFFVVGGLLLMAKPAPVDLTALGEYNHHYGRFVRDYFGCPAGALRLEECAGEASGFFNAGEWAKSRSLAKKLYGLRED